MGFGFVEVLKFGFLIMLSNHFQNGIETARLVWSRIPNSEDLYVDDGVGILKKNDGSGVESLDYEVIENYAYREEQVFVFILIILSYVCLDLLDSLLLCLM